MNEICLFVSDLHGKVHRYEKLFKAIREEKPGALFIGGDILPSSVLHSFRAGENKPDFITDYLAPKFQELKKELGNDYPSIFIIMGNDDPRIEEETLKEFDKKGLWNYIHGKVVEFGSYQILGYSYVPPTPFLLKDWERYDIDESLQPGCVAPPEGFRTFQPDADHDKITIEEELSKLGKLLKKKKSIYLFHSPPYGSGLDKVAFDAASAVAGNPDPNVGSKAIAGFTKTTSPHITLHGHIHESSRLTGVWKEQNGSTVSMSAAYEGPGLAIIKFIASEPSSAERILL